MSISLKDYLIAKLNEVEKMHDYEVATDTVRAWIDLYEEQPDLPAENTVMWWLCRIADDKVRRKAVGYAGEWGYQGLVDDFRDAMWVGFLWQNTEEGYDFWEKVDEEQAPLLPTPEWKEYLELRK